MNCTGLWKGRLTSALLVCFAPAVLAEVDINDFPIPDFMDVTIVGENLVFNGMPMHAYTFTSTQSEEEVVRFYQDEWDDKMTDQELPPWRILAHREGDTLFTVQLFSGFDAPGARGHISIMPLFDEKYRKSAGEDLGKGFPLMPGTTVINDIEANDTGKRSRTLVLHNDGSVRRHMDFYRRTFLKKGWAEIPQAKERPDAPDVPMLVMNRSGKELNMAFTSIKGTTQTVAVVVEK